MTGARSPIPREYSSTLFPDESYVLWCWSPNAWPLKAYRIDPTQPLTYKYRLSPVSGDFTARTREAF